MLDCALGSIVSSSKESQLKSREPWLPKKKTGNDRGGGAVVGVLHDAELKGTNKENNLGEARSGDGIGAVDCSPAIGGRIRRSVPSIR
jgi:hypothetical protein